jgi:hypothetical protein
MTFLSPSIKKDISRGLILAIILFCLAAVCSLSSGCFLGFHLVDINPKIHLGSLDNQPFSPSKVKLLISNPTPQEIMVTVVCEKFEYPEETLMTLITIPPNRDGYAKFVVANHGRYYCLLVGQTQSKNKVIIDM